MRDDEFTSNTISGDIHGTAIQAGVIKHLTLTTAGDTRRRPEQLPPTPTGFVNRSNELFALTSLAFEKSPATPVVVVSGIRGTGKSAFATRWAHDHSVKYTDGHLFANYSDSRRDGVVAVEDIVAGFLSALGVANGAMPRAFAERVQLYRTLTSNKRFLIVLDDVEHAAEVVPLIPASSQACVLVTTNHSLQELIEDGAEPIRIQPLDRPESAALLDAMRANTEADDLDAILDYCDGLPLALRVCGAWLKRTAKTSSSLLAELNAGRRIDDRWNKVFDAALHALPPDAAAIYRAFGLHPSAVATIDALAHVAGLSADDGRDAVDQLVDAGLVDLHGAFRCRMHTLIHRHASTTMASNARNASMQRLLDWYLTHAQAADRTLIADRLRIGTQEQPNLRFPHASDAIDWLHAERSNLVSAIRLGAQYERPDVSWRLCEATWNYYFNYKNYADWILAHRIGISAAHSLGNDAAEARIRAQLARAQMELGDYELAEQELTTSRELASTTQLPDLVASTYEFTGILDLERGRPDDAIGWLSQSHAMFTALEWPRAINIQNLHLGRALIAAGRPGEAVALLTTAAATIDPVDDAVTLGHVRIELGIAFKDADQQAALHELKAGLEIVETLALPFDTARAHLALGDVYAASGSREMATASWGLARSLFAAIDSPEFNEADRRLVEAG